MSLLYQGVLRCFKIKGPITLKTQLSLQCDPLPAHSFIHSFNQLLLSTYYMPVGILGAKDIIVKRWRGSLWFSGVHILMKGIGIKKKKNKYGEWQVL